MSRTRPARVLCFLGTWEQYICIQRAHDNIAGRMAHQLPHHSSAHNHGASRNQKECLDPVPGLFNHLSGSRRPLSRRRPPITLAKHRPSKSAAQREIVVRNDPIGSSSTQLCPNRVFNDAGKIATSAFRACTFSASYAINPKPKT